MSLPDATETLPSSDWRTSSLTRVQIRDYKSIATADIHLGTFTILVGRNGSGKSNFLDALRLIADGLQDSPELFPGQKTRDRRDQKAAFPDRRLAIYIRWP